MGYLKKYDDGEGARPFVTGWYFNHPEHLRRALNETLLNDDWTWEPRAGRGLEVSRSCGEALLSETTSLATYVVIHARMNNDNNPLSFNPEAGSIAWRVFDKYND